MAYRNKDGLVWKYGLDEAKLTNIAGYRTHGDLRYVEVLVDNDVPAADAVIDDNLVIPKGAQIVKVEWDKAPVNIVGGNVNIGLANVNGTTVDADGLVAAATPAELNADGVGDGALIDTVLVNAQKVSWSATAPITAGNNTIRIFYRIPKNEVDTLVYVKP